MDIAEAEDYVQGMNARDRAGWEQSRLLMFFLSSALGGKATTVTEFMPFSWDNREEPDTRGLDDEEREALWAEAQKLEKILNNGSK